MDHSSNPLFSPLFYYVVSLMSVQMIAIFHLVYMAASVAKNTYVNKGHFKAALKQSYEKHKRGFAYIYATFAIAIIVPFGIQYYQFHKNAIVYESAMAANFTAKDFMGICKEDGHGAIYKYNAEQNVTYARCDDPFTISTVRFPGKASQQIVTYTQGSKGSHD